MKFIFVYEILFKKIALVFIQIHAMYLYNYYYIYTYYSSNNTITILPIKSYFILLVNPLFLPTEWKKKNSFAVNIERHNAFPTMNTQSKTTPAFDFHPLKWLILNWLFKRSFTFHFYFHSKIKVTNDKGNFLINQAVNLLKGLNSEYLS